MPLEVATVIADVEAAASAVAHVVETTEIIVCPFADRTEMLIARVANVDSLLHMVTTIAEAKAKHLCEVVEGSVGTTLC